MRSLTFLICAATLTTAAWAQLVRDGRIVGAVGVGGSAPNEGDIAKRAATVSSIDRSR